MSRKKTQIDRAIEALEADLASMQLTHDAQMSAIRAAVSKLREQKSRVPARRKKNVIGPGPVDGGAK